MSKQGAPLLLFAVVFGVAGCGAEVETAESQACNRDSYIRQSNEFKASEGEPLRDVTSAKPIVRGYFGKLYNRDWLKTVGRSSIEDTIRYIESKGARVYHADSIAEQSARNFERLPRMSPEIERQWRQTDRMRRSETCAFTTGLYLPKNAEVPVLEQNAAIVVRKDSSRWTLVHEFMHHNFEVQSAAANYDDQTTQRARIKALGAFSRIMRDESLSDAEKIRQATPEFLDAVRAIDKLLVEYALEEITIESMLQDAFDAGELKYVPAGAYQNASWYINLSDEEIHEGYAEVDRVYDELRRLAKSTGNQAEYDALSEYTALKEARLDQLEKITKKRNVRPGVGSSAQSGAIERGAGWMDASSQAEGFEPCGVASALRRDMGEVKRTLRTLRQ